MAGTHFQPNYTTNAEWAWAYTRLGWHTLALAPNSEEPHAGSHGVYDSAADFAKLEPLFAKEPRSNVAIDPAKSGIIAADFDYRNGGSDLLAFIIARHGSKILDTATVTKKSGPHHYWLDPGSYPKCNLRLPKKSPVDFIGAAPFAARKYIVAPRSFHPDGYPYEWLAGHSPWEHKIKTFPAEILPTIEEYFALKGDTTNVPDFDLERRRALLLSENDPTGTLLYEYDSDPRFVRFLCERLRIEFKDRAGFGFRSPLRKDEHPSAALYECKQGSYRYHDFAEDLDCSLVQLYGAWVTGRDAPLPNQKGVTYATWHTRMRLDLGVTDCPVPVSLDPLPAGVTELVRQVWNGFGLLLQCRAVRYDEVRPVPYTYDFAADWCGITRSESECAIKWLKKTDYLITVDKDRSNPTHPTSLRIALTMTDADVVSRVAELWHVAYNEVRKERCRAMGWKPNFYVHLRGRAAVQLMERLLPLMGQRRQAQIQRALASYNPYLRSKLRPEQVAEIRSKLAQGLKHHEIASQYGIDRSTVSHIKAGLRATYR